MSNPNLAKVMLFDIEASSLNASFGHTLCFGYKYYGEKKTKVLTLADFPEATLAEEIDCHLVRHVHNLLTNEADIIVTYYGKGYDRPFLNTRMLLSGCPPLPPLSHEHVDLYFCARHHLKLHSNRLQAVSETLGCPLSKTPVRADTWLRAQRGDVKALAYVTKHCELDVRILEWVYDKLRPFIRTHPFVGRREDCRVCGSAKSQSRGFTVSKIGGKQRRVVCTDCGSWRVERVV